MLLLFVIRCTTVSCDLACGRNRQCKGHAVLEMYLRIVMCWPDHEGLDPVLWLFDVNLLC